MLITSQADVALATERATGHALAEHQGSMDADCERCVYLAALVGIDLSR